VKVFVEKVWPGYGGSCIFSGRGDDGEMRRFVLGAGGVPPATGEVWDIEGEPEAHPVYGNQIRVAGAEHSRPSGLILVRFLSAHEAFRGTGIGQTRASALWARFGDSLFDILENGDAGALAEEEKLPRESIGPLLSAWRSVMAESRLVRWLTQYEFPPSLARKVLDNYGEDGEGRIMRNPYNLLAFASWAKCDAAAAKLGVAPDDPRRLTAAVQQCLYRNLDAGHTRMETHHLVSECSRLLGVLPGSDATGKALEEAVAAGAVHRDGEWVSSLGVRMLETDAVLRFGRLLEPLPADLHPDLFPGDRDSSVREAIESFERHAGHPLNEDQKQAVRMAMTRRFSVLTGGAGVGKTTVLKALVEHYGDSLFLMALTGQAAKRMAEATGRAATTIERFIRKDSASAGDGKIPFIVVDEASMLDLPTTVRLLRAIPDNAKMMLVGDPGQLPPVSFGLIFHRIAESGKVPKTNLSVIIRQKESSGIPEASRLVREGKTPPFIAYVGAGHGVSMIPADRNRIRNIVVDLKADMPDAQILAPRNAGGVGVDDVNLVFHGIRQTGKDILPGWNFAVGDPVIYKKNDSEIDLVNGSLGTVLSVGQSPDGEWFLEGGFSGIKVAVGSSRLPNLRLAYALTVHSAQGSQFGRVVVVIEKSRILDRTWVYTALTRGVRQVVFVGDTDAFEKAVREKPVAHGRNVMFGL
jgi:exodeoxyribonuclease V alpha subunit